MSLTRVANFPRSEKSTADLPVMQRVRKCSARLRDDNRSEMQGVCTDIYIQYTLTWSTVVDAGRIQPSVHPRVRLCARIGTNSYAAVCMYVRYVTPFTHYISVAGGSEPRLSAFRGEATTIVTRHALSAHLFAYTHRLTPRREIQDDIGKKSYVFATRKIVN